MRHPHLALRWGLGLAVSLAAAHPAAAQDWTRFRGPNGTGISSATTVPAQFTEADFNWKVELPGQGHSSPVLWGKRIFLTSAQADQSKRYLLCLDANGGKELWRRTFDFTKYPKHNYNSFASCTPAVDDERVYLVWATPEMATLFAADHTGKTVWQQDLGPYPAQHGNASSPIVVGDMVIISNEPDEGMGVLMGLDRKTGAVRWKRERESKPAVYATPLVYEPQDGPPELIFSSTVHGITSVDPKTGAVNWELRDVFKLRCVASPVLLPGGLIFQATGTGNGDKLAVAVAPGSRRENTPAKVVFQPTRGLSYVPTPVVFNDLLFLWGDAGIVTCLRAKTGEPVWMERVGGNFFGSPICVGGKLYALSAQGDVVVVDAAEQFKVISRVPLGELSHSTPAVSDGVLYLRTEKHLVSVGGKK